MEDGRVHKIGRLLRRSSLDEIPEIVNVLRGEMSLVGPRPLLVEYLTCYTEREARRHDVLPGITGLAQVMGRDDLTWKEKFEYDLEYVDNHSVWRDSLILVQTILVAVSGRGAQNGVDGLVENFAVSVGKQKEEESLESPFQMKGSDSGESDQASDAKGIS